MFWPLMGHDCTNIVECLKSYGLDIREDREFLWHRKFSNLDEKKSILSRINLADRLVELSNLEEGVYVTSLIASR